MHRERFLSWWGRFQEVGKMSSPELPADHHICHPYGFHRHEVCVSIF